MNEFLQIAIGLVPSIIAIILLCIKRKVFNVKIFSLMAFLILICIGMFYIGGNNIKFINGYRGTNNNEIKEIKNNDNTNYPSKNQILSLANKLYFNDEYDLAKNLIDDYSNIYDYDNECRLLNARMNLVKTDYVAAMSLYQNLEKQGKLSKEDKEELEFVKKLTGDEAFNLQAMNYLVNTGCDLSEYGYKDSDYSDLKQNLIYDNETIASSIKNKVKKQYMDDAGNTYSDIAEVIVRISTSNKKYENLKEDINKLDEVIKDEKNILNLNTVDRLNTKACFLDRDYEKIVSNLNDESSYHSLILSADLLMNKLIDNDISNNINNNISSEMVDLVEKKLEDIQIKNASKLNKQQQNLLKDKIDILTSQLADTTLCAIKNKLEESYYDEKDESKVYFALAKINNYFDNHTLSDAYLHSAINSAYKSDDTQYKGAMNNLGSVFNDKNDYYNVPAISNYINRANINSLTIDNELNLPAVMENSDKQSFVKDATNNIIKATNYVSIVEIDISKFKTVSANVIITNEQLKTAGELKNSVEIRDCGSIVDAKFEKVNYDNMNIMLACDVSGSMLENIDFLKSSLIKFIDDKNDNEKLSIISFDRSITGERSFNASKEALYKFVDSFNANDGTNIYDTVQNCIKKFPSANNSSKNILIVMTDGKDSTSHKVNEINVKIGQLAQEKGVTIYTMGLGGDIDEEYLNYIARAGGGSYIPVQDGDSLSTFYDMLHMQVNNLYKITYDATNISEKYDRTLEVILIDSMYKDLETYSLVSEDEIQVSHEFDGGQVINGVYPQSIYKSDFETNVVLKGQNFNNDDDVSIKFMGPVEYRIDTQFKDNDNYYLAIPRNISVGNYDVVVTINDIKKVLYNSFRVNEVSEKKWIKFGAYNFTYEGNDSIDKTGGTLSGNVQMNGWLNFKGKLVFRGDYEEDYHLEFTDSSGSYIEFDKNNSTGKAKEFATDNIVMNLPALKKFKLYNDEHNRYDYDKYKVDSIKIPELEIPNYVSFGGDTAKLYLYPDKVVFSVNDDIQLLSFNKTFRKITKGSIPLEFGFSLEKAIVSSTLIGIKIKTEFNMANVVSKMISLKIFNQEIISSPSAKLTLDSIKDEYEVEIACKLGFLEEINKDGDKESPKLSLGFGVKKNAFEKIKINTILPNPIILMVYPPLEANNFAFEVSNISDAIKKGDWAKIKLKGQMDLSSCKVSEYIPFLKKVPVVKKASIVSMPKTTLSLTFSPFAIEGNAKLMLLGLMEAVSCEVKIANYKYTSSILNIRNEDLSGILLGLKGGLTMNGIGGYFEDRFIVDLSGKITGMFNERFIGFTALGTTIFKASFWAFEKNYSAYSESAIGFYTTHSGKSMLVFATKGQNKNGKNESSFHYLDENLSIGQKNGQLS